MCFKSLHIWLLKAIEFEIPVKPFNFTFLKVSPSQMMTQRLARGASFAWWLLADYRQVWIFHIYITHFQWEKISFRMCSCYFFFYSLNTNEEFWKTPNILRNMVFIVNIASLGFSRSWREWEREIFSSFILLALQCWIFYFQLISFAPIQ